MLSLFPILMWFLPESKYCSENLQSGKQCLCRYLLPSSLGESQLLHNLKFSENMAFASDVKIIGLADSIEGRINVIVNSGKVN